MKCRNWGLLGELVLAFVNFVFAVASARFSDPSRCKTNWIACFLGFRSTPGSKKQEEVHNGAV